MIDWLWSTALYAGMLIALAGAAGVVWPLRRIHGRSRRRALVMLLGGIAFAFVLTRMMPPVTASAAGHAIDEFAPQFHFREHHEMVVAATPERVFAAIKSVPADEIALFNLFTGIRRGGRPGPESILNAPGQQPILDVATRSGFLLLSEQAPREVVIGVVVVAPPGTRRPDSFTADNYKALAAPGFAKATMNFLVEDLGNGRCRVVTETRIFATDRVALGRFTPYWRVIFPGSAILRSTWLRAIKRRAERTSS